MDQSTQGETLIYIASETNGIENDVISMLEGIESKLFGVSQLESKEPSATTPQEPMLEKSLLSARQKANRISSIVSNILNRI